MRFVKSVQAVPANIVDFPRSSRFLAVETLPNTHTHTHEFIWRLINMKTFLIDQKKRRHFYGVQLGMTRRQHAIAFWQMSPTLPLTDLWHIEVQNVEERRWRFRPDCVYMPAGGRLLVLNFPCKWCPQLSLSDVLLLRSFSTFRFAWLCFLLFLLLLLFVFLFCFLFCSAQWAHKTQLSR